MSHRVVASSGGGNLREEWGTGESWKAGGNLRRLGGIFGRHLVGGEIFLGLRLGGDLLISPPHLEIVNLGPITIFCFQYNKMVLFEEGEQCFCSIKSDTKETDSDFLGSGDFSIEVTYYYFTCTSTFKINFDRKL